MLLILAGGMLAVLGLLSALVLVVSPLGWVAVSPGWSLWIFFPLFTLVGYGLVAVASRDPAAKAPTLFLATPLLLVALVAAVALVCAGAGLVSPASSAPLWYVLVLGGLMGVLGSAVSGRRAGG